MPAVNIDYYIYYRIRPDTGLSLTAALASMQASLHAATGVAGRVRRRIDDPSTWMEIYEGVTDQQRFELELGSHVKRHLLHDYVLEGSARHMERFRSP